MTGPAIASAIPATRTSTARRVRESAPFFSAAAAWLAVRYGRNWWRASRTSTTVVVR